MLVLVLINSVKIFNWKYIIIIDILQLNLLGFLFKHHEQLLKIVQAKSSQFLLGNKPSSIVDVVSVFVETKGNVSASIRECSKNFWYQMYPQNV